MADKNLRQEILRTMVEGGNPVSSKDPPVMPERESFLRGYHAAEVRIKIPRQIYAYAVCLAAVIAFMVTLPRVVRAMMDYRDPLTAEGSASDIDLSSVETFRRGMLLKLGAREYGYWLFHENEIAKDYGWSAYVAVRNTRSLEIQNRSLTTILSYSPILLLALLLFASHLWFARRVAVR